MPRLCQNPNAIAGPATYKLRLLFRAVACLLLILPPFSESLDLFNLLEAVEPASIDAGTILCRLVPGARARQVARPERPAPALTRPNRIDHTLFAAGAVLQEYTVFGRLMFDNRRSKPDPPEVFPPELPHRHF